MRRRQRTATTMRRTMRLEAFSDAVLAIAMTLPLTELVLPPVPQGGDLAGAFRDLAPEYIAYLSSSAVIGLYWVHAHFSGKIIRATDHIYNLLTIVFLVAVSLTSVPNTPFFEHISDPANVGLAAKIYATVLAFPSVAWLVMWIYADRRGLFDRRLDRSFMKASGRRHAALAGGFVMAASITLAGAWQVGMSVIAALFLTYLLPPLRPVYLPGAEPSETIEEADEL